MSDSDIIIVPYDPFKRRYKNALLFMCACKFAREESILSMLPYDTAEIIGKMVCFEKLDLCGKVKFAAMYDGDYCFPMYCLSANHVCWVKNVTTHLHCVPGCLVCCRPVYGSFYCRMHDPKDALEKLIFPEDTEVALFPVACVKCKRAEYTWKNHQRICEDCAGPYKKYDLQNDPYAWIHVSNDLKKPYIEYLKGILNVPGFDRVELNGDYMDNDRAFFEENIFSVYGDGSSDEKRQKIMNE